MINWKNYTPEGVGDILEGECAAKTCIEENIKAVFTSNGYYEVKTPTFEFYDVFEGETGVDANDMIRFFDRDGRIMALRPDITVPLARICATKFNSDTFPKRVCYTESAFRSGGNVSGAMQTEFTQAGIEFFGENSPTADAEVIAVTIKALLSCGLDDFKIEIGQSEFFKGIMEQAGLDEKKAEELRELIDSKSFVAVEELIGSYNISSELKKLITELPNMFGGIDIAEKIKNVELGKRAKNALDNLIEVYNILINWGYEKYISIDLGMVNRLKYYTGIIIKGFAHGVGFPICGGGRYDNLVEKYGKKVYATGVAIGIDRIMSALKHGDGEFLTPVSDTVVCWEDDYVFAYKTAEILRQRGLNVELWHKNSGAEEYAKAKGIGGVIKVVDKNTFEITNVNDMSVAKVSAQELLGGEIE